MAKPLATLSAFLRWERLRRGKTVRTVARPLLIGVLLPGSLLGGCQLLDEPPGQSAQLPQVAVATTSTQRAIAVLSSTEGNAVSGVAKFTQNNEDTVTIEIEVTGLKPNGVYAWHIHEFGDLSDPAGKAAGGHYNPDNHPHALPNNLKRHAGDLGNLTADAKGGARMELTVDNISINGSKNPILGRAVIIHAEEDDGGQPTGNAGDRLAQGVIGIRQIAQ